MKKKILSLFLALTLCLSLLPTAAFAEGDTQDPAEPGEELLVPEQPEKPEDDPAPEQEEHQEDPSVKQDEVVAAVQALMDALPGEVTADNADELQAQLMAIDAALEELTDEQTAKLDLTRYEALCEALSGLTAVLAETTSGHTGDHGEYTLPEGKTWTGINNITAEMDAGYYYLTDDVTISSTWKPKDGVVLCLNGYGITLSADGPAIQVQPDVTFTLCDCNGSNNGRYSSIRHSGGTNETHGIGVLVGALDSVSNTAVFNMYGGTISYNTSISDGDVEGGGVTVAGGTFNMYGGTISDNKSLFGKGIGGGVFIANHGTFNMSGGEITQNGAKIGGGVFVGGYYGADATEKEKDANYGGTFHMSGGSITGNTAGGGVYVNYYPTTFTVSGTAQITGNKSGSETSNVYLSKRTEDGQTSYAPPIVVDGTLTGSIGVTTAKVGQTVATGVSRAAKGCFTPDNSSKYRLQYDNDVQTLTMIAATHENHPICGASCTHDGKHTGESWTPISDLSEIKGNGNYYLTNNVKLTASWTSGSYNGRNVKLCLNGFDIIANVDDSAIKLSTHDGNTLTLCDCVGSGEITHGVKADGSKYTGAGVEVPGTQTFNMYGGTITGNKNTFGGGVLLGNGSTFNMSGGSITGNKADANSTSTSDGLGGGVCAKGVSGGAKITFNMYGGTIEDNTATNRGGGVYVGNDAQFSMSGGSITGNTAAQGGGVYYVAFNSLYVSGNVNITGNKGTDGKANNVYVPSSSGTPKTVPFYIAWYVLNEDARIGVRVDDNLIATGEHSPVAQVSVYGDKTNAYHEGNFIPDNGDNYGFKMEESEHDTLTPNVVNLYNGLPHQHPICGETCTHTGSEKHTDVTWTPLTSQNGVLYRDGHSVSTTNSNSGLKTVYYILPEGNYYLPESITIDKPILISSNMNLCLNGNTLSTTLDQGRQDLTLIAVYQDKTLNLCDCDAEGKGTLKTENNLTFGVEIWYPFTDGHTGGTFNMYGGTITGVQRGVRLYVESKGGKSTFKMYGGKITGTKRGVYVNDGSIFEMYGGEITGNDTMPTSTEDKVYFGGGVVVDIGATFTMHGGTISNNNAYSGGGVCLLGESDRATTTFNMEGGTITGNTTTDGGGGGVYLGTNTAFNMSGDAAITGNTASSGGGVYVKDATFSMSGSASVTGNTASSGGGVLVTGNYSKGKFNMSGNASVSGNTTTSSGGGVYMSNSNSFTMSGGSITGNSATLYGGGVDVNGGSFTMSGGSITGNNVTGTSGENADHFGHGGGVYVYGQNTAMTVSGDVQIRDNWKNGELDSESGVYKKGSTGNANNLYLYSNDGTTEVYKTVTISGALSGAKIGVSTYLKPENKGGKILIATDAQDGVDYTEIFTPDVQGQGYTITQTDNKLYLSAHTHDWEYSVSADNQTIIAECKDTTCTSKNGGSVTIVAPDESTLTYDGNTKEATLEGALTTGVTLPDIKYYYKIGEHEYQLETGAKPTNAKSYRAEITVGSVNASVTYEIKKATPQASDFTFSGPNDPTYDGNAKFATVTSTKIDGDYITVKYYQGEKEVSNPTDAGTYTVKINVAESGNYNAAPDLTDDPNWKFTIQTNNTAPDVTLSGEMVYKREKIEPTATVKIGNATLVKDQDYTVTYGTNFDAGMNTGVVYIEAKGNYGFEKVTKYFNIAKKPITVTAENKSSRVGQDLAELTYTHTEGLPYEGDTFFGKLETNANKDTAGTYQITKGDLTLGNNYEITFQDGTYTVQEKLQQSDFKFAGVENNGKVTKTYGPDTEFTIAATNAATDSTVTYSSDNTNVATVDNDGRVTIVGAGTAVIKATASATDDYAQGVATYELTVSPKTLTADDLEFTQSSIFTKTYDGDTACTTATVQIKDSAKVTSGDELPTVTGTYAYNSKDVKDATKVTFTSAASDNTNYILPEGLTVENAANITKRVLTVGKVDTISKTYNTLDNALDCVTGIELIGTVSGETLRFYTSAETGGDYGIYETKFDNANAGQNKTITGTVALLESSALASNYTFKVDGKESSTAPFTATGEITPADGGSKGDMERTQKFTDGDPKTETIAWKQLLPAGQTWNYISEYYSASSVTVDHRTDDNGALTYTITGGKENDVVVFTVSAKCNNYNDFTYTVRVTLTARDSQALEFKGVENGKVTKTYGNQPFTQTVTGEKTDVTYASSNERVATVDNDGKVTIVGAGDTTITATAAQTNDYASASASYTLTVNKLRIAVPAPGKNKLEYDGTTQTYMPDRLDTAYCTITDNTAKDVRANNAHYTATVSLNDKANTEWDIATENDTSNQMYDFWITPATAIVTALDKKITTSQSAPALANAKLGEDYTITGLYGSDSLGSIVLYYADPSNTATEVNPDTSKAGTYAIVAVGGTGNSNYAPTFHTGTLTIANRPSSGGGAVTYPVSIPDKVENGSVSSDVKNASKGSTVTITIKPEDGFKLANLTVIDKDGNKLEIADKGDGKYTFIMPAGKVEVKASFTKEVETSPFADVATDAYYYEAVKWAAEQGITGGTGSGLFSPDYTCTRAQIVTFLWRAAGSPEPKAMSGFSDVPENSYYAKAVAWAVENGITVGTSSTTFSPEATCTRAQSVTFLFRAAKASADGTPAFSDVTANAYYAEAVKWATDNGITNGIGGGLFGPDNDCTRAQIVTFLWRLYAGK